MLPQDVINQSIIALTSQSATSLTGTPGTLPRAGTWRRPAARTACSTWTASARAPR